MKLLETWLELLGPLTNQDFTYFLLLSLGSWLKILWFLRIACDSLSLEHLIDMSAAIMIIYMCAQKEVASVVWFDRCVQVPLDQIISFSI